MTFTKYVAKNKWIYIFLLPGIAYFLYFHYFPMYGLHIAFKDYNVLLGFAKSPWAGLKHFRVLFKDPMFYRIFRNTMLICLYKLLVGFPFPILISLFLNEIRLLAFKRTIQSIIYVPHFISWPVIGGITYALLSPQWGAIAGIFELLHIEPVNFLTSKEHFRGILVMTSLWKTFGWNTIVYLAALTMIDPELYEAAMIDGAGRFRRMWHVSVPGIMHVIVILLLLRVGTILDTGFDQVMSLANPMVLEVAEIFDTYTYKVGILEWRFSYTTAVGLFKSAIGLVLVVGANSISRKVYRQGAIW